MSREVHLPRHWQTASRQNLLQQTESASSRVTFDAYLPACLNNNRRVVNWIGRQTGVPALPIRLLPAVNHCVPSAYKTPSRQVILSPSSFSLPQHTRTSRTATSFIQQVCTMASNRNNQYRCAVGGEWKDISEFSRSQQRRARPNNRENSGMICLAHSQPSRAEITCTVCCRTRPIDQYSNNERKSDNPVCCWASMESFH